MVDESGRGGAGAARQAGLDREGAPAPGAAARTGAARRERVGGTHRSQGARLGRGRRRGRVARGLLPAYPDRRPAHAMGVVFSGRHALLQLAARAGALLGARLRGRPRALPLALPRPLAALLATRRGAPPALARATGLAARARARVACLQAVRISPPHSGGRVHLNWAMKPRVLTASLAR